MGLHSQQHSRVSTALHEDTCAGALPDVLLLLLLLLLLLQVSLRSMLAAGWAGRMTNTSGGRTHCQQRSSTLQVRPNTLLHPHRSVGSAVYCLPGGMVGEHAQYTICGATYALLSNCHLPQLTTDNLEAILTNSYLPLMLLLPLLLLLQLQRPSASLSL
jgi:hypothetical protein